VAHDFHRAALAVLCVFAVVFAASLFPATGFGTNPVPSSGPGVGSGAGEPASGEPSSGDEPTTTGTTGTSSGDEPTTTRDSAEKTVTSSTTTDEAGGSTTDGDSVATTTTTTTAATTTETSAYEESASGGLQGALLAFGSILVSFVLVVLVAAIGFGRHHRRRNPSDWNLPSAPHLRVLAYVRRIPQTSLAFVMFAGANAPGILDQLGSAVGDATSGFGAATAGVGKLGSAVGSALVKVPAGFVSGIAAFGRGLGSLSLAWPSFSTGVASGGFFSTSTDKPGSDPRSGGRSEPVDAESEGPEPPASVREAWDRLQEDLGVGGSDGRTPGQIARAAVDRGVPSDAMGSLTRTFREVRYGGRPDDDERVAVARRAYRRVRTALDGDSS